MVTLKVLNLPPSTPIWPQIMSTSTLDYPTTLICQIARFNLWVVQMSWWEGEDSYGIQGVR